MAIIATEGLKEICRRVPGLVFDPINFGIIAIESYAPKKETTMNHGRAIKYDIITIEPSDNKGFVVTVGCGTFVYETTGSLLKDLTAFLDDPDKAEKGYYAGRGAEPDGTEETAQGEEQTMPQPDDELGLKPLWPRKGTETEGEGLKADQWSPNDIRKAQEMAQEMVDAGIIPEDPVKRRLKTDLTEETAQGRGGDEPMGVEDFQQIRDTAAQHLRDPQE